MKTILDYLNMLPKGVAKKAIDNYNQQLYSELSINNIKLFYAEVEQNKNDIVVLGYAFSWDESNEGFDFWGNFIDEYSEYKKYVDIVNEFKEKYG